MNLISAYIDGELTGAEMLSIRRHLSECAECAREYESLLGLKEAMARLRTVLPRRDFVADVFEKLQAQQMEPRGWLSAWTARFMGARLSPVTVALAVFGVALMLLTAGDMEGFRAGIPQQSVSIPQTAQLAFVREISLPQTTLDLNRPVVIGSVSQTPSPEISFASLRQ